MAISSSDILAKGSLHPLTPLFAFRFVINHTLTKPTKVWVRLWDGRHRHPLMSPIENIKLEPGKLNEEIGDRAETDKHEIPVDKPRYLVLEIRKDNEQGRVLFKRRYPFRQIPPGPVHPLVEDGFDPVDNTAYVNVWHSKSDSVCGPSEVTVSLDGQALTTVLNRGAAEQWWRYYPKPPLPVAQAHPGRASPRRVQRQNRHGRDSSREGPQRSKPSSGQIPTAGSMCSPPFYSESDH